jgi:NADP-dependent 3-hydroxy acid dehydrogenase YdfG
MAGSLDGKVAAITGASSGIGAATAVALAREGAAVALGARRVERLEELKQQIESDGGRAIAMGTDISDESQACAFVEGARDELGRLDILVNNAGLMLLGPVLGTDTEEWRRMVDVNLMGLLYCTNAALPIMAEQQSGHIVNLSSVAGRVASLGSAVYNLTKWGVGAFSEALRQEALNFGVRVTIVEPGFVETELQGHNKNPMVVEQLEKMRERVEPLQADDIADAIAYAVTRPPHVSINEVLVRPTRQPR